MCALGWERWVAVSTPLNQSAGCLPDRDLQLQADRHTPHGAYRLIPRLKFTFAPSRLNSHFSSSHNTPLSRDTGMMSFLLTAHAKCVQWLFLFFVHINTVYDTLHEYHLG